MVLMKVSGAAPDCALIWMLALMDSSTSRQQTFGNPSHRGIHLAVVLVLRTVHSPIFCSSFRVRLSSGALRLLETRKTFFVFIRPIDKIAISPYGKAQILTDMLGGETLLGGRRP